MPRSTAVRRLLLHSVLFPLAAVLPVPGAPPEPAPGEWVSLFDGKTLGNWKETPFTGRGAVRVENSAIFFGPGKPMTGVTWTGSFPKLNYEIRFEGVRLQGSDFFASLTFPVGDSFATWVTGGWGGDIVGISSIDGWDASENETRTYFDFEPGRWYKLRLEVTGERIRAWIDEELIIGVPIAGRSIDLRFGEIRLSAPLGFASYATLGAVRNIEYRLLRPPDGDRGGGK
jgi:hypothetical protein